RGAGAPLPGPHRRPDQAVEALTHGPLLAEPVGRVLEGQGRDDGCDLDARIAVVGGRVRRQAARPAELHRPPAVVGSLRRYPPRAGVASAPAGGSGLAAAPEGRPQLDSGEVLTLAAPGGMPEPTPPGGAWPFGPTR